MTVPKLSVTIDLPKDPALYVADHNRNLREAWGVGADFHHRQHMPRHFMVIGGPKYGFKPRSKKYNARKIKVVGHNIPNVFSGRSRTEITSKRQILKTPKGAKLKMRLPITGGTGRILTAEAAARLFAAGKRKNKGFTQRQINSQKTIIERVAEMEVVSADEVRTVARELKNHYVTEANKPGQRRKIRIDVGR